MKFINNKKRGKMKKLIELLAKIKEYFKRFLKQKHTLLLEENKQLEAEKTEEDEEEKKGFFELYHNVKNVNISIENLMINDLIKVLLMMQNETNIYDKKIKNKKDEILKMDTEISALKKANDIYTKRLQESN